MGPWKQPAVPRILAQLGLRGVGAGGPRPHTPRGAIVQLKWLIAANELRPPPSIPCNCTACFSLPPLRGRRKGGS